MAPFLLHWRCIMNEISIALLCSLLGTFIGIAGYMRLNRKDIKEDTTSNTRLEAKLDYVSKGVDDIRLDIRDQGRKIEGMNDRLIRCEESTKSLHHRLDEHLNIKGED